MNMRTQETIRYFFVLLFILAFSVHNLFADEWIVPEEKKSEVATFKFTDEVITKGLDLYNKNCQSCHGIPTKKNWANIQPVPGDMADEKFRKDTDGDLFFKITAGRGPMPQFKNILGEQDRWSIVAYIRTFHPGYVQPDPEKALAAAKGGKARIEARWDSVEHKITYHVLHTKDNVTNPASKATLLIFVKRYFGNLSIGETRTNDKGYAVFQIPDSIPGDKDGMLAIIARLSEASGYGEAEKTMELKAGSPSQWVSLTDPRAMWNVRAKAPVWLILSYSLTLIGVLATLVFILLQIRKIHSLGKINE